MIEFERSLYFLPGSFPAVFYLADGDGILINSPRFDSALLARLKALAPLNFIFYPAISGRWKWMSGAPPAALKPWPGTTKRS